MKHLTKGLLTECLVILLGNSLAISQEIYYKYYNDEIEGDFKDEQRQKSSTI
jgi:hypothetical protein